MKATCMTHLLLTHIIVVRTHIIEMNSYGKFGDSLNLPHVVEYVFPDRSSHLGIIQRMLCRPFASQDDR